MHRACCCTRRFGSMAWKRSSPTRSLRWRQAHAEYYLRLAEGAEAHLEGAEQVVWLERLEREHANLRIALQWQLSRHADEVALRMGSALFRFWEGHRHLSEGRTFLESGLASSQDVPSRVRARALYTTGI